jgi:geranylgeranyl reductase family protein
VHIIILRKDTINYYYDKGVQNNNDIIIAGAGLSGLMAAKSASGNGLSVKVLEEDQEVGLPEKCDGLVSVQGLKELGINPSNRTIQAKIKKAILHSPNGTDIHIDASKKDIIVVDRSEFDVSIAKDVTLNDGVIELGNRILSYKESETGIEVKSKNGNYKCKVFIDGTGISYLASKRKSGLLQAAKYIVSGKDISEDTVELFFNQEVTPGFFVWLIPAGDGLAKLGCGGNIINGFSVLDKHLEKMKLKPVRKMASSIYVGGPLEKFVNNEIMLVGDAAGQTKPTTAGGIYSGGMGGLIAGKTAVQYLKDNKNSKILHNYEKQWKDMFQRDFELTRISRNLFERLDNKAIDKVFSLILKKGIDNDISNEGEFDFHSSVLKKIFVSKDTVDLLGTVAGSEMRRMTKILRRK